MNIQEPERSMNIVFELAKTKALIRNSKPGNTETPWSDFSVEHLKKRFDEEIQEWKESDNSQELIDIINLAAFLWLAKLTKNVEEASNI